MNTDQSKKAVFKQKAIHEGEEMFGIFLYLAFFFCAVVTYSKILLHQYDVSYFSYGTALLNALIVAKVILIGEYARLGHKREAKPLFQVATYKAFLFSLLVFVFHIIEEVIKHLVHGEKIMGALHNVQMDILLSRSLVVFCTFIPLFAFRELQRVLGEENFRSLFFKTGAMSKSDSADEKR